MTSAPNRPAELNAFTETLTALGRIRVPLREVWELWRAAAPRLVGDPAQASMLAAALDTLVGRDVIELPVGAWDNSTTPPLPRSITVPSARRAPRSRSWDRFPWCPELGWAASLPSLTDARFEDLIAINDWVIRSRGREEPVLPMRYRSVQLFGDEKHLERLARTTLFGPGRLSFDDLACVRIPPPLAAAVIAPGPDILVLENSDTYWTAIDVLRACSGHPVGVVAWGAGRAFPSQVPALKVDVAGRGQAEGVIWYWGDLDPDGLVIASEAAVAGELNELRVRPADALWEAMAERPVQDPGTVDWTAAPGEEWLGSPLWHRLGHIRSVGGRVAQESVAAAALVSWAAGL